jgi:Sap, sulfolipid-1-addressing protein
MGLILPILLLGLLASLSPTTLVVFILLLSTARARVNAVAFLIGWAVSLTIVFTASYALGASHAAQRGSGRTAVQVAEIFLGLVLLGVGVRQWRNRHTQAENAAGWGSERFTGRLRSLNPWGAAAVGILKQPWAITTAAAIVVVHHHPAFLVAVIAFVCFTIASTATIGMIYLYYARRPGEAQAYLSTLQDRVVAAGPAIVAVVAVLVGALLTIDGLRGLTGG